ncbi:MAG: PAS domain-containing protein [Bacteroidales bacterium]|nr:PAS domain-containing protein [Bacteroidales bacterium]
MERQNLQKRYDYLMKSANDIILLVDKAGRFVEVNERALDAYGYTKEEFFQRLSTADIIAPQDRESFQQKMDESKKAGAYVREGRHARKDGSEFPVEASARWIESMASNCCRSLYSPRGTIFTRINSFSARQWMQASMSFTSSIRFHSISGMPIRGPSGIWDILWMK